MSNVTPKIAAFWSWFEANERLIRRVRHPSEPAWEVVRDELKRIHPGLWFEIASDAGRNEFTVTVDGDRSLVSLADAVVALAPRASLTRWTFVALMPPCGLDEPVSYENVVLEPRSMQVVVQPPDRPSGGGAPVDLRIGVAGLRDDQVDAAEFAARLVLRRCLGERRGATEIGSIEVVPLPVDPAAHGFQPLEELPAILDRLSTNG
jgi:hypothetical protein